MADSGPLHPKKLIVRRVIWGRKLGENKLTHSKLKAKAKLTSYDVN